MRAISRAAHFQSSTTGWVVTDSARRHMTDNSPSLNPAKGTRQTLAYGQ